MHTIRLAVLILWLWPRLSLLPHFHSEDKIKHQHFLAVIESCFTKITVSVECGNPNRKKAKIKHAPLCNSNSSSREPESREKHVINVSTNEKFLACEIQNVTRNESGKKQVRWCQHLHLWDWKRNVEVNLHCLLASVTLTQQQNISSINPPFLC